MARWMLFLLLAGCPRALRVPNAAKGVHEHEINSAVEVTFWPTVFGRAFGTGCRLSVCL